jgi:hypothetical protein
MSNEEAWLASLSPKELLLLVLAGMDIPVLADEGKYVQVANDYTIEVEGPSLYKLVHHGQVVAPFSDVVDLCAFIKTV